MTKLQSQQNILTCLSQGEMSDKVIQSIFECSSDTLLQQAVQRNAPNIHCSIKRLSCSIDYWLSTS